MSSGQRQGGPSESGDSLYMKMQVAKGQWFVVLENGVEGGGWGSINSWP